MCSKFGFILAGKTLTGFSRLRFKSLDMGRHGVVTEIKSAKGGRPYARICAFRQWTKSITGTVIVIK
jgi:hypothetical protein